MSSQATSEADSPAGVVPAAPWRVCEVGALPQWRLAVRFNDGTRGTVDLAAIVTSADAGVFAALRDPQFFSRVYLEYGAVTWPNGADLAPDAMHRAIREHGVWTVEA